jgi:SAM-dependent methyltransferase
MSWMYEPSPYDAVAAAYDELTSAHAHEPWLAAIERLALRHGLRGRRVLDVACGTGKSFAPLLQRGYDVTACDASAAMVQRAREAAGGVPVLVEDMRKLPRLGAFDLITCLDDAVNHLVDVDDVLAALRGMRGNLSPNGLLVFDVNLPTAYEQAADAIIDRGRRVVLWRLAREPAGGGDVDVLVDVFTARPDGLWERDQMRQPHRRYGVAEIRRLAATAGLRVLAVHGQRAGGELTDDLDEARDRKALFVLTSNV